MRLRFSNLLFGVLALVLGFSTLSAASQPVRSGVEISTTDNGSELVQFHAADTVNIIKSFALNNPNRVVIDVGRAGVGKMNLPKTYTQGLVRAIRVGQFDGTTTRIVLDLNGPAKVVKAISGAPFSIEILATGPVKPSPKAIVEKAKPLIIIDAGHGGQDPGAIGLHGTQEKDVTLNYARALKAALLATGRYRAALTRSDDTFVVLPERVAIARKQKGDIFISFHADSNPRAEARGLSIYTLSETASDAEAAALAEHENKADVLPGIDLRGADADVASILIDLTQRETMNKSSLFADAVVDSLSGKITKLQKVHRYAGFRVLKAPDIPSVLIELGFLSNEMDERLLLSPDYRELIVGSVVKGIDRFYAGE